MEEVFESPHVLPLLKLYSTLKPEIAGGASIVNAPHPALTVGVAGAGGKITTLTGSLSQAAPAEAPAATVPQAVSTTYLALSVWQPGVVGIVGAEIKAPLSMLHSTVNPVIVATDGSINEETQVFNGVAKTGFCGNTNALVLLSPQGLKVPAGIVTKPEVQSELVLYLLLIVQQPGVFVNSTFAAARLPYALKVPDGD